MERNDSSTWNRRDPARPRRKPGEGRAHKSSDERAGSLEGVRGGRSTGRQGQHNLVEPEGAREGPLLKQSVRSGSKREGMPVKATAPMDKVRQLQRKLYVSAKKSKTRRFHALYERIHDWGVLLESWKRVRAKGGAGGMDEETIKTIEAQGVEVFLRGIQMYLKEGRYHPMP